VSTYDHRQAISTSSPVYSVGVRRHGQEGALASLWKCCKVFSCISSYSKTLNRQIIYALFSQHVVGFWRLHPWTPSGDFYPETPNLPTSGKNPSGVYA